MTDKKNHESNEVAEHSLLEAVLALSEKLSSLEQKMNAVPQDRHTEEHDYLKLEMEVKQARRNFYRGVSEKLATTSIIGAFGLLITALGYGLTQWIISLKP